ncbi:MAG: hypothetical protein ACOYLE_04675 [Bacteroidales bacterium]
MKKNKYIYSFVFICIICITLFLTFNRHSRSGYFNYHSVIWSDKAGYYVYLPAAVKYNFNPENFPDSIEKKTGNGFFLDYKNKKLITKYTYGVALLELPFFLAADIFAETFGYERNGFSPIYHWSINIASVFYLLLGMFFLGKYLKTHFKPRIVYLVLLSLFLSTNLYYYSIDETGMSHVYSFALFCIFLYLLQKTNYLLTQNYFSILLFGFISALIVLVRPSNIIFLFIYFFLDIDTKTEILLRVKRLVVPKTFLPVLISVLIVISPQLYYWYYAHGSSVFYSYNNEGFNWTSPQLLLTWFSPNNGLFAYNPVFLIIVFSLICMVKEKITNGIFILGLFIIISYVFSSWWAWNFGCSFGARSYVEYLGILSIPLAYIYEKVNHQNRLVYIGFWLLIMVLTLFNLKMTYSYDGCFYGSAFWDWSEFLKLIKSPLK